jgi:hypothetical protein
LTEQQAVTHRADFAKPEVDEEAIMLVMAGEEPTETETQKHISNTKELFQSQRS